MVTENFDLMCFEREYNCVNHKYRFEKAGTLSHEIYRIHSHNSLLIRFQLKTDYYEIS